MGRLERYSLGIGDRFGRQGTAQLRAFLLASDAGINVTPVWNKSHREHTLIGSTPAHVRQEADVAVRTLGWTAAYFVDADHVGWATVEPFLEVSDFFTLDVADHIGRPPDPDHVRRFVRAHGEWAGVRLPSFDRPLANSLEEIARMGQRYLVAVQEAGRVFRRIRERKRESEVVIELSLDEARESQTAGELFFTLAAAADEGMSLGTVAPRFPGRFLKGVDYQGDREEFGRAFRQYLSVIQVAVRAFGLPEDLKLSLHSGSDKFSLYPVLREILRETGAGLHVKTAGTTWLEELRGLVLAGSEGWKLVRDLYRAAWHRWQPLCAPYATVVAVDQAKLPLPEEVDRWSPEAFCAAMTHDPLCPAFRPDLRQLLHVSYPIAAEMGPRFFQALDAHADRIAAGVTANLWERHLRPLFG